jgi:hypothetical protein
VLSYGRSSQNQSLYGTCTACHCQLNFDTQLGWRYSVGMLVDHRKIQPGVCAHCGETFLGYTTRTTCSPVCRQYVWRRRHRAVYN